MSGAVAPEQPGLDAPTRAGAHLFELVRRTLERPLASYQLILGTSGLLLGLGLIMVLSASSVWSQEQLDSHDMFGVFKKQFVFALLGLVGAYLAARLPLSVLRRLVTPVLIIIVAMILATFSPLGMEINGNRNWLEPRAGPSGATVRIREAGRGAVDCQPLRPPPPGHRPADDLADGAGYGCSCGTGRRPGRPRHCAGPLRRHRRACSGSSGLPARLHGRRACRPGV